MAERFSNESGLCVKTMLCESVVAKKYDDGNAVIALPMLCKVAVPIGEVVEIKVVRVSNMIPPFVRHLSAIVVRRNSFEVIPIVILENHQTIVREKRRERRFVDRADQTFGHQGRRGNFAALAINAVFRLEVFQS